MPISLSENVASGMFRSFATRRPVKLFVKASSHDVILSYTDLFQVFSLGYITKLN